MKKKAIITAQILAAAFVLAGCGSTKEEEKRETDPSTTAPVTEATSEAASEAASESSTEEAATEATTVADAESGEKDADYYKSEVYGTVLDNYTRLIQETVKNKDSQNYDLDSVKDLQDMPGFTGIQEFVYSYPDTAMDQLGFLIQDFSGDGIPELAVGIIGEDSEDPSNNIIFAMYTSVDEEPTGVFDGWYRSRYYAMSGDRFGYFGSGSAATGAFGDFKLSTDGTTLEWEDYYFADYGPGMDQTVLFFHNTTGDMDQDSSEKLDISQDDFWSKQDAFTSEAVALPLTPFADYAAE